MTVKIKIVEDGVKEKLTRIEIQGPRRLRSAINRWGKQIFERNAKSGFASVSKGYTNRTINAIHWENIPAGGTVGRLVGNEAALYIDRASPHYYSIKRGRRIWDWAQRVPIKTTVNKSKILRKGGAVTGGYIYFTPKPYIGMSFLRSKNSLKNYMNQEVRKI